MKHMRTASVVAALSIGCSAAAWADEASEKALKQQVDELQKQLETLSQRVGDGSNRGSDELEQRIAELEKVTKKDQDGLFAYYKNGLKLDSADGAFKLSVFGRIQDDYTFWHTNDDLSSTIGETNVAEEFRRARLGVSGTIYKNVFYKAEWDFAGGAANFTDVYMQVNDPFCGTGINVKVGHFDEPFGLDHVTSSKYSTFTERGIQEALVPARNAGIELLGQAFDNKLAWFAGFFRDSNNFGNDTGNDNVGEHNLTGRITGRPWISEDGTQYVHLGIAASERNPSQETVQITSRPEVHTGPTFLDTGAIADIDSRFQWSLEAAGVWGPFSLQGEMITDNLSGKNGQEDLTFRGTSIQGSYFLTGENREYDVKEARFDRVKVKKNFGTDGMGAWELALRYSKLDLADGSLDGHFDSTTGKFTAGGELSDWTFGVNWYLNPNTRVMFDITKAKRTDLQSLTAFTVRFAIDF